MKKTIFIVIMCTLLCTSITFSEDYTVSVQSEGPPGVSVKYSGDFEGTGEVPFIIGPYPAPYTVYLEPTVVEIEKPGGMGYYFAGFPHTSGSDVVAACEVTSRQPEITKSIFFLDYDGPTPTPGLTSMPSATTGTRGYIRGTIRDMDTGEGIEGATVLIYDPNTGSQPLNLTTSAYGEFDTGYFGNPGDMKMTEWYLEVFKAGYYTGEKYLYCWTCATIIDLIPVAGSSPQPLPSYSPTPPANPTPTPVSKSLWRPVKLITRPDMSITSDGEISVRYYFQTPCIRAVDWGEPTIDGDTVVIDPFFIYWDGSDFTPTHYLTHIYQVEGIDIEVGNDRTFRFVSWDGSWFETNPDLRTPAPTQPGTEIETHPSLFVDVATKERQTTATLTSLFFQSSVKDIVYEMREKGTINRSGNTFILSPVIIKIDDSSPNSINQLSLDYPLGELDPGTYTISVTANGNTVLSEDFTVIDPLSTPQPPRGELSGHIENSAKLFLYGKASRVVKPDSNGNYVISNLSSDGYYALRPVYVPQLPHTEFLSPENNTVVNGYTEFALHVMPDVVSYEYEPELRTYNGVTSQLTGQDFTIVRASDVKTTIYRVVYYMDGEEVYRDTTYAYDDFTYLFYYDTTLLSNGYHTLKAEIYESSNRFAEQEIRFEVTGGTTGLLGDVNNDNTVSIIDALLTAQYYVGLNPEGFIPGRADVNCDGSIDIIDALLIAQYYVGLVTGFC
ncbi:MAG: hypothetical protein JXB88_24705 [Spirochaetales bacterium]|nr:hypothetical protein [Spirochaetales bacterium]